MGQAGGRIDHRVLIEEDRAGNMAGVIFGPGEAVLGRQIPGGVDDREARPPEHFGKIAGTNEKGVLGHRSIATCRSHGS